MSCTDYFLVIIPVLHGCKSTFIISVADVGVNKYLNASCVTITKSWFRFLSLYRALFKDKKHDLGNVW